MLWHLSPTFFIEHVGGVVSPDAIPSTVGMPPKSVTVVEPDHVVLAKVQYILRRDVLVDSMSQVFGRKKTRWM